MAGKANKAIDGRGNCWPRLTLVLLVLPASQHVYTTLFMYVCVCCMHKGAQSRQRGGAAAKKSASKASAA